MNKIAEIMIGTIRAQVCGSEYKIDKDITQEELNQLYILSKSQDMAHIVGAELEKQGILKSGDEVSEKFRKQQMIAIFRYERINYELEEICRVLEEAQIPHMPLKGSVIRKYYPEPWMRTSCDIDILVHESDLKKATEICASKLNYQVDDEVIYHNVSLYSEIGIHLELHFSISGCVYDVDNFLSKVWEHSLVEKGTRYRYCQTNEFLYFYIVTHLLSHFIYGGCGVKPVLDVYILNKKLSFDNNLVLGYLTRCKIQTFHENINYLSCVWFCDSPHTHITLQLQTFILNGGAYGSQENRYAVAQGSQGGSVRYFFSRVFVPYSILKRQYKILDKYKVLFPIITVFRWFKIISPKRINNTVDEVKHTHTIDKEKINDVRDILTTLGLDSESGFIIR